MRDGSRRPVPASALHPAGRCPDRPGRRHVGVPLSDTFGIACAKQRFAEGIEAVQQALHAAQARAGPTPGAMAVAQCRNADRPWQDAHLPQGLLAVAGLIDRMQHRLENRRSTKPWLTAYATCLKVAGYDVTSRQQLYWVIWEKASPQARPQTCRGPRRGRPFSGARRSITRTRPRQSRCCCDSCTASSTPATRWSWSSTTWTRSPPPTGSSTLARAAETRAAGSSRQALPTRSPKPRAAPPRAISRRGLCTPERVRCPTTVRSSSPSAHLGNPNGVAPVLVAVGSPDTVAATTTVARPKPQAPGALHKDCPGSVDSLMCPRRQCTLPPRWSRSASRRRRSRWIRRCTRRGASTGRRRNRRSPRGRRTARSGHCRRRSSAGGPANWCPYRQ
jgi:hypothetical protein